MRHMRRLLMAVVALAVLLVGVGAPAHATTATVIPVFGDSVAAGGWLPDPEQGWVGDLGRAEGSSGIVFENYAVGGMALDEPATDKPVLLDRVREVFAAWKAQGRPAPATVILAIGTNDMISHDVGLPGWDGRNLYYSEYAATLVRAFLIAQGVKRVVWNSVYPFAVAMPKDTYPGYVLPSWVGPLMTRVHSFNGWLSAMYGADYVNTEWTLVDWSCWCKGRPEYFLDGFHPNAAGHAQVAWQMERAAGLALAA